jgi:hypothetical protein
MRGFIVLCALTAGLSATLPAWAELRVERRSKTVEHVTPRETVLTIETQFVIEDSFSAPVARPDHRKAEAFLYPRRSSDKPKQ